VVRANDDELRVSVPLNRPDIEREIDLIEEAARINGYDNIPAVKKITITLGEKEDESTFTATVREISAGLGFYEMINNPLQSEKLAAMTGDPVKLLNPLSSDMAYLRTSLIPGALAVIERNINAGEKNLELFEIGNVFNKKVQGEIKSFDDFEERTKLLFIISGKMKEKTWIGDEKQSDFYYLKGAINSFLCKISLDNALNDFYYQEENRIFDITYSKKSSEAESGYGGRVKKEVLKQFDIQQDVFCFEFDFDLLKRIKRSDKKYKEPLRFPKIIRDFAFIFDKEVAFEDAKKHIIKSGSGLLKSVEIFDIFESQTLGENKKSMAFTLEFYDTGRTLTEEEVEKEFNSLISAVAEKFNAKLRGT
jgi:phenylalanyl-tRNA synthetase beta chain